MKRRNFFSKIAAVAAIGATAKADVVEIPDGFKSDDWPLKPKRPPEVVRDRVRILMISNHVFFDQSTIGVEYEIIRPDGETVRRSVVAIPGPFELDLS